jgi:hypothetical protein
MGYNGMLNEGEMETYHEANHAYEKNNSTTAIGTLLDANKGYVQGNTTIGTGHSSHAGNDCVADKVVQIGNGYIAQTDNMDVIHANGYTYPVIPNQYVVIRPHSNIENSYGLTLSNISDDDIINYSKLPIIADVKIIVPNKVIKVFFTDGSFEKSVCDEEDTFSLEAGINICIMKKVLGGTKAYNKYMTAVFDTIKRNRKAEADAIAEEKRLYLKRQNKKMKKKRREERRKAEQQMMLAEAMVKANDIMRERTKESIIKHEAQFIGVDIESSNDTDLDVDIASIRTRL